MYILLNIIQQIKKYLVIRNHNRPWPSSLWDQNPNSQECLVDDADFELYHINEEIWRRAEIKSPPIQNPPDQATPTLISQNLIENQFQQIGNLSNSSTQSVR